MGTWGTGPFENDTAADFSYTLDAATPAGRVELVRRVLTRLPATGGYLYHAQEAVAGAAVLAAQCPDGRPVDPDLGPKLPLQDVPDDLRLLAAQALDRVAADERENGSWFEPADARRWRAMVQSLRDVLDPPPVSYDVPLFEV